MESAMILPRPGSSRQSLVQECVDAVALAIRNGTAPPGSRLPSEAELAQTLNVSRATLRDALRILEEQRLIVRKHGLGTFVEASAFEIEKDLRRNTGITAMIRAAGYVPGTITQSKSVVHANEEVATRLNVAPDAQVLRWERVRLADGRPVVLSVEIIPTSLFPASELQELQDSDEVLSLLHTLYTRRGIAIHRASAELIPTTATQDLADLLRVQPGDPMLCIKQVDFDSTGTAVVYSVAHHVANWVHFTVERTGPGVPHDA